jgi:glycosyltransferase involved in cell wall biosynthesis
MRVLFVTHNIPRFEGDAAGSFVLRLAVALQGQGHQVDVVAPGGAMLPANDRIEGVNIERVPYGAPDRMTLAYTGTMAEAVRASWSGRWALLRLLRAMRRATLRRVRTAIRDRAPYDVVHVHWWFPSGLALWRAFGRARTPLVLTMHGSDVRLAHKLAPVHPLMRAVLAQASERTTVSRWLARSVSAIAPELPVSVAPMPVNTKLFQAPVAQNANGDARDGILFVGRLNEQKGLAAALDALALPALAHATLDVVGDGPDAEFLRAHAASHGVSPRVRWHQTHAQSELVQFYQRACCVVMPSREEGLGLVAVEAQLCGTPVVAFNSGGLPDVVRPASGGALVDVGDVAALADALAELVNHPAEARRRGELARADMLAEFSETSVAARYEAVYRTATGASGFDARG